jgi:hypothetical protein
LTTTERNNPLLEGFSEKAHASAHNWRQPLTLCQNRLALHLIYHLAGTTF